MPDLDYLGEVGHRSAGSPGVTGRRGRVSRSKCRSAPSSRPTFGVSAIAAMYSRPRSLRAVGAAVSRRPGARRAGPVFASGGLMDYWYRVEDRYAPGPGALPMTRAAGYLGLRCGSSLSGPGHRTALGHHGRTAREFSAPPMRTARCSARSSMRRWSPACPIALPLDGDRRLRIRSPSIDRARAAGFLATAAGSLLGIECRAPAKPRRNGILTEVHTVPCPPDPWSTNGHPFRSCFPGNSRSRA